MAGTASFRCGTTATRSTTWWWSRGSLDQNQLASLPDALGKMPALKGVILFRNPIPKGDVEKYRAQWPHLKLTI